MSREKRLSLARTKLEALQGGGAGFRNVLPFGDARIDAVLSGGLPLGRWHEASGEGLENETGAAAAAFVAALVSPLARRGPVVWVMRRDDLYAPGLSTLGFPAERLIQVKAEDEAQILAALEEALATAGVVAAIGEAEGIDLIAGRRLQLACERGRTTGFVIRRRPFGGGGANSAAAATRWKVASAPSVPEEGGLGPPRWRVILERCRGGRTGAWLMEKTDGANALRVVADLADREFPAAQPLRLAG